MRHSATSCPQPGSAIRRTLLLVATAGLATVGSTNAQDPRGDVSLDWRPVGNTLIEAGLADPASGPADRVWYSATGETLYARTASGKVFAWLDSDEQNGRWLPASASAPVTVTLLAGGAIPEQGARVVDTGPAASPYRYAWAASVFRSSDEGRSWTNVTRFRGVSLIGEGIADLAVSPANPEELTTATSRGVWRSVDGGLSWSGLNAGLPNLPVRRILAIRPLRVETNDGEAVWQPAARDSAWNLTSPEVLSTEQSRRRRIEDSLASAIAAPSTSPVTADASAGDWIYAAAAGRIWISPDRGRTWRASPTPVTGTVARLLTFETEPRTALALLSATAGTRLLRTVNGGLFWEDITSNLAAVSIRGFAADFESGSVYAATSAGLYHAGADLLRAAPAPQWQPIGDSLPSASAVDAMLDPAGSQLYVALEGHGIWAALAPHRFRDPRLVNAADRSTRAAAPGTLLSVLGALVSSARSGAFPVPVLAASGAETQIQVPFEVNGSQIDLQLTSAGAAGTLSLSMPLRPVSPAIFIDPDGAPMILDADLGVLLDAGSPARAGSRIQILATGLGRVTPAWPTGLAAPAGSPPRVVAPVRVLVDRVPVEVRKATLAPGYIGFYVVEIQLPEVVNNGPAELSIEAGGQQSSAVTLYLVQ